MSFTESIKQYSAAVLVAALGCPRDTAYAWLHGTRKPPVWLQEMILAKVRAYVAGK